MSYSVARMSHPASTSAAPELRQREFRGGVVSGDERLGAVYRLDALRRISMVRAGVPAAVLPTLAKATSIPREKLYVMLGLPGPPRIASYRRGSDSARTRASGCSDCCGLLARPRRSSSTLDRRSASTRPRDTPDDDAADLTGQGARLSGGRWNRTGTPMVYVSTTRALACLETVVWGTGWGQRQDAVLAGVPAVAVPEEQNVLVNPTHPDAARLRDLKVHRWLYDGRLDSR